MIQYNGFEGLQHKNMDLNNIAVTAGASVENVAVDRRSLGAYFSKGRAYRKLSFEDDIYMELEYGMLKTRVVHKVLINKSLPT